MNVANKNKRPFVSIFDLSISGFQGEQSSITLALTPLPSMNFPASQAVFGAGTF
jgi:hypothetical protein